jgi:universal stress protein E
MHENIAASLRSEVSMKRKSKQRAALRTILVAVAAPMARKQPVIDRAAQLATVPGARLVLFHAAFNVELSGHPFLNSTSLAKARGWYVSDRTRALEYHAKSLRLRGLEVDVAVVWEEPAHESIIRAAIRGKVDLVVVGRHEQRPEEVAQFRLTDWELMRLCPKPLLVVHPDTALSSTGAVLAALDPTHGNDKPASLDTSIARWAVSIAQALQVESSAVHVMKPSAYPSGATAAQRRRLNELRKEQMKDIMTNADADPDVKEVHVLRGWVDQSLRDYARKLPAQLLAMGIISRRWMQRLLVGDTAESVVRGVPCDLLLIKPNDFQLRLGRARQEHVMLPRPDKMPPVRTSKAKAKRAVQRSATRQPKRKTR